GSAQRGTGARFGRSQGTRRRRSQDDQRRRDQGGSRRDQEKDRSGRGQSRNQVISRRGRRAIKACVPAAGVSEIFSLEAVDYFQNRTRRTTYNPGNKTVARNLTAPDLLLFFCSLLAAKAVSLHSPSRHRPRSRQQSL